VGFADLIDSQRTLLELRQLIAESSIERERRLVELEALAGVTSRHWHRPQPCRRRIHFGKRRTGTNTTAATAPPARLGRRDNMNGEFLHDVGS